MEELMTISLKRYKELLDSEKKLHALEAGGVDNWQWYSESLQQHGYFDDNEESEEDIYGTD